MGGERIQPVQVPLRKGRADVVESPTVVRVFAGN